MKLLAVAIAGRGVVDPAEPVFFADDEAVVRGAAAFETIRLRNGAPVLLAPHLERLARSALALGHRAPEAVEELVADAVAAAGSDEATLRVFWTGRTLVATVSELPPGLDALRARGLHVVTFRAGDEHGLLEGVKATSYAVNMAALADAQRRGADDALFLGAGEIVRDLTTANVWWRDGDVLSTPAPAPGVLPGVTRRAIADLARGAGYRVREGAWTLPALLRADEAFASSAVREIVPLASLDGRELARGKAGLELQRLLEPVR